MKKRAPMSWPVSKGALNALLRCPSIPPPRRPSADGCPKSLRPARISIDMTTQSKLFNQ